MALRRLAQRNGATLFMVLLASFQAVLSRWSGCADILVGTLVAGRPLRELEGLVGLFTNIVPLRTDTSGNPSFCELLTRAKGTALAAFAHQDIPLVVLEAELNGGRPFIQVLISLQTAFTVPVLQAPILAIEPLDTDTHVARRDLSLSLVDTADGLHGTLEYARELFEARTVERLAGRLEAVLTTVASNPDAKILDPAHDVTTGPACW
jgi:non-ribosomal peptide synthetase component F